MDNQLARGWTTSWPWSRKNVDNQLTPQLIFLWESPCVQLTCHDIDLNGTPLAQVVNWCSDVQLLLAQSLISSTIDGKKQRGSSLISSSPTRAASGSFASSSSPALSIPCRWKSWTETFLGILYAKIMHNIFLFVCNPNSLGNFLLSVGQDQLGENCQTYSRIWGSRIL